MLLSLIGILAGLAGGMLMIVLYWLIALPVDGFMGGNADSFEALSTPQRLMFIWAGICALTLLFWLSPRHWRRVGVPFVIERINYHQGRLPIGNALFQFFAATIALASGLSVGKEGPAAHIGATFGSQLADQLKLPQNRVLILLTCGIAGAIAAAFHTPLAGVLFALEVVLFEFQLAMLLPVLLSSVSAMVLSKWLLGDLTLFEVTSLTVPELDINVVAHLLMLAAVIVVLAGVFFRVQKVLWWNVAKIHFFWRFALVGVLTSLCAIWVPEVLGGGYDSLLLLMSEQSLLTPLIFVLILKVLLTSASIGLGIPGGMIGPTFVIGGLAGAMVAGFISPDLGELSMVPLFVLLGMGAMMAACFQAPLTALVAIIEMTHSPDVLLSAMLVVGLSCLMVRVVLLQDSVFVEQLKFAGLKAKIGPVTRHLRNYAVRHCALAVMRSPELISYDRIKDFQSSMVEYLVLESSSGYKLLPKEQIDGLLDNLDLGPQVWWVDSEENRLIAMARASEPAAVECIDEPESLEAMIDWFRTHRTEQVLIRSSGDKKISLVQRRLLDQFLLKG